MQNCGFQLNAILKCGEVDGESKACGFITIICESQVENDGFLSLVVFSNFIRDDRYGIVVDGLRRVRAWGDAQFRNSSLGDLKGFAKHFITERNNFFHFKFNGGCFTGQRIGGDNID